MSYIISAHNSQTKETKIAYELSGITDDLSYATLLSKQFALMCENELLGTWEGQAINRSTPYYNTQ